MLLPDFSENQSKNGIPTPDFAGIKRQNGGAAIIRVSFGTDHGDFCFERNRRAAQRHKYAFLGLYQFVIGDGDIGAQARFFCQLVGKLAPNEIPIADIEEGSGDQSRRAEKWFSIVDSKLGLSELPLSKRSWLYAGENFLINQLAGVRATKRNIWVAAYRPEEPTLGHVLWQSTDGGVNGIHKISWPGAGKCDTNLFHGTLRQLAAVISRDDLPYPRKEILKIVQKGVAAELQADLGSEGITFARGAEAAVHAQQALADIAQRMDELRDMLRQAQPGSPGMEHAGTP